MTEDRDSEQVVTGFGIRSGQEPKYGINTAGRLFNRSTGVEIPDDEPVIVFRAKDIHASQAIAAYLSVCNDPDHCAVVKSRLLDFEQFAQAHPERMREPTSSLKDLAGANVGPRAAANDIAIQIQPVKSSNLSGIGYDAASQTLEVRFYSGAHYHFRGVPQSVFDEFLTSDSKGSFFATRVRGKFEGLKLERAPA